MYAESEYLPLSYSLAIDYQYSNVTSLTVILFKRRFT